MSRLDPKRPLMQNAEKKAGIEEAPEAPGSAEESEKRGFRRGVLIASGVVAGATLLFCIVAAFLAWRSVPDADEKEALLLLVNDFVDCLYNRPYEVCVDDHCHESAKETFLGNPEFANTMREKLGPRMGGHAIENSWRGHLDATTKYGRGRRVEFSIKAMYETRGPVTERIVVMRTGDGPFGIITFHLDIIP